MNYPGKQTVTKIYRAHTESQPVSARTVGERKKVAHLEGRREDN